MLYLSTRNDYGRAMEKKPTKPLKTLQLRKEALKTLTANQLVRVQGGSLDPWDPSFGTNCTTCYQTVA